MPQKGFLLVDRSALSGRGRGIVVAQAETADPAIVNTMASAGGVVSVAITASRALWFGLRDQQAFHTRAGKPVYLASVESARCRSTGISVADRRQTIRTLGSRSADGFALKSPGHVLPCLIDPNRMIRDGAICLPTLAHTAAIAFEAALATAWTDILGSRGDLASTEECLAFALKHGLSVLEADTLLNNLAEDRAPDGHEIENRQDLSLLRNRRADKG